MTKLKLFLTTLVCFLTTISYSQQQIDLEKELPVDPKVKIGKLDNGLVYYIRKNKKPEKRVELRISSESRLHARNRRTG
jgi:zinc protease